MRSDVSFVAFFRYFVRLDIFNTDRYVFMNFLKKLFGGSSAEVPQTDSAELQTAVAEENATDKNALRQADTLKFDALRALKFNEIDFAIQALGKSIELSPRFETRYYLGMALVKANRQEEALDQFSLVLHEQPEHTLTLLQRAHLHLQHGSYAEAVADAEKVLLLTEEDEQKLTAGRLIAESYAGGEDWAAAVQALDAAIALPEQDNYEVRLLRARYLVNLNEYDRAEEDLQILAEQNPHEELVPLVRARMARARRSDEDAMMHYREALELDPFNDMAYRGLAELMPDRSAALELIGTVFEEQPHNLSIGLLLKQLLEEQGKAEEAVALAEKLKAMEPKVGQDPDQVAKGLYSGGIY